MPRKTLEEIAKMSPDEQFAAMDVMSEFEPDKIFTQEEQNYINDRVFGKDAKGNSIIIDQANGYDTRSLLFMWMMAKMELRTEDILNMDANTVKSYVSAFKEDIDKELAFFAEDGKPLSEEEKERRVTAWGEIMGKASNVISEDVRMPSGADLKNVDIEPNTFLAYNHYYQNSNIAICHSLGETATQLRRGIRNDLSPQKDENGNSKTNQQLGQKLDDGFKKQNKTGASVLRKGA